MTVADPRSRGGWALLLHEFVKGEYSIRLAMQWRPEQVRVNGAWMEHSCALLIA